MKKLFTVALTIAMTLFIGGTNIFAVPNGAGVKFVDLNKDGVCDNFTDDGKYSQGRICNQNGRGYGKQI